MIGARSFRAPSGSFNCLPLAHASPASSSSGRSRAGAFCRTYIVIHSAIERSSAERSRSSGIQETLESIDLLVPGADVKDDFQALGNAAENVRPAPEPQYIWLNAAGGPKPDLKKWAAAEQSKSKTLPLSYILLGSNIIIYSAGITQAINHGVEDAQNWFGLFANSQLAVLQHHEVYRLAAASLMHGSLLHLTATSLALFNFAPGIEKRFGRWQFGAIFALSGIAGNLATLAATNHAAVGATGALFGITGALLAYQFKNGKLNQPAQAGLYAVGLVALDFVANHASNTFGFSAGNLGGFAAGAVLGLGLAPRLLADKTQRQGARAQYGAVSGVQRAVVLLSATLAEGSVLAWLLFISDNASA